MQWQLLDAVSSTHSLSVLLSAMETSRTTQTALALAQRPSSEIIHTCACAAYILATATIWGWSLVCSELPIVNGSFALQHFEHGNVVELHNGIMFDFYPGLPHIYSIRWNCVRIGAHSPVLHNGCCSGHFGIIRCPHFRGIAEDKQTNRVYCAYSMSLGNISNAYYIETVN